VLTPFQHRPCPLFNFPAKGSATDRRGLAARGLQREASEALTALAPRAEGGIENKATKSRDSPPHLKPKGGRFLISLLVSPVSVSFQ